MIRKIVLNTEVFVPEMAKVNSVIAAKNALPILGDIRIETKDDGNGGVYAVLMASDSETWLKVKATVESESEVDVVFCVEAKTWLQALRNLGNQMVTLELDDEKHIVACKYTNGVFQLPYDDAAEYPMPILGANGEKTKKHVDSRKMLTSLERAGFATANDELRPVMNGIHFDFFADGMVSVATDGHKMAKYKDLTVTHNGTDPTVHGFTLPAKPSHILMNILSATTVGDVAVVFDDRTVVVSNNLFVLTARLIEGRYPNYDSVIPTSNNISVTINKGDFVAALKRVLPMSATSELTALTFSDGQVQVSAEDFDFSKSATERVECDYAGTGFAIGFKGSTLLQLVQNIDTTAFCIQMTAPDRAGVITEDAQNAVYEYTSLIMPMMIQ